MANEIIETHSYVESQFSVYFEEEDGVHSESMSEELKRILSLPIDVKYRILLQDQRIGYVSMREEDTK